MTQLLSISKAEDIPPRYQGTPIEWLLAYHNLDHPFDSYSKAQLLIGTCMDHRVQLRIPKKFAYVLRTGGANLQRSEFHISYAIGVGGVTSIAVIGHTDCGMVNIKNRKDPFIQGLEANAGWVRDEAETHFRKCVPENEIGNEIDFVLSEVKRLQLRYPKAQVAPMLFDVEDRMLYLIPEECVSTE